MVIYTSKELLITARYDTQCSTSPCNFVLDIGADVQAPIYLYYGLTGFNQNHRFYENSRSDNQL